MKTVIVDRDLIRLAMEFDTFVNFRLRVRVERFSRSTRGSLGVEDGNEPQSRNIAEPWPETLTTALPAAA